ncbi:MAG TPA: hypothetical protein VFG63_01085 [Nocardioidaceae bacterium]|nr:hypothetical protein [Nocardioidaceae bacterium]
MFNASLFKSRVGAVAVGTTVLLTLGGVGGAVAGNMVGSADIRNGSVKKIDLGRNAVGTIEIKNGTVRAMDLSDGVRSQLSQRGATGPAGADGAAGVDGAVGPAGPAGPVGAEGPQGPEGPEGDEGDQGEQGVQGEQGAPGADGVSGYHVAEVAATVTGNTGSVTVSCAAGEVALGGGAKGTLDIAQSYPALVGELNSWTTEFTSTASNVKSFAGTGYVVCALAG